MFFTIGGAHSHPLCQMRKELTWCMGNNCALIQKTCDSLLQYKTLSDKEQQCMDAFFKMKKGFELYQMENCFNVFFANVFQDFLFLGIKTACERGDMSFMLNGIFQGNRIRMLKSNWLSRGIDHSEELVGVILAFAANDLALVEKMTPISLGLSVNGYYKSQYNMIYALFRKDSEMEKTAEKQLHQFLSKKQSKFDIIFSQYLLELYYGNITGISNCLQELCNSITRANWVQEDIFLSTSYYKLGRSVALFVHGLYHLAHFCLEEEDFLQIKMPEHKTFINVYEVFNRKNGFLSGDNLIPFTHISRFMERFTDLDIIPELSLYTHPLAGDKLLDVSSFQSDYFNNLQLNDLLSFRWEEDKYVFQSIS